MADFSRRFLVAKGEGYSGFENAKKEDPSAVRRQRTFQRAMVDWQTGKKFEPYRARGASLAISDRLSAGVYGVSPPNEPDRLDSRSRSLDVKVVSIRRRAAKCLQMA